jgi:hypothetical protein
MRLTWKFFAVSSQQLRCKNLHLERTRLTRSAVSRSDGCFLLIQMLKQHQAERTITCSCVLRSFTELQPATLLRHTKLHGLHGFHGKGGKKEWVDSVALASQSSPRYVLNIDDGVQL